MLLCNVTCATCACVPTKITVDKIMFIICYKVQKLATDGSIFSSCVSLTTSTHSSIIYVGSHDSHMYCWESIGSNKYQVKWKCQLDSPVYSTCCVCNSDTEDKPFNREGKLKYKIEKIVQHICKNV